MLVKIKDNTNDYAVATAIDMAFRGSRFDVGVEVTQRGVKVAPVRLRESKKNCGSHPNACEVEGPGRKSKFLEGADWVDFNDMLNDALDKLEVAADIKSMVCWMRKGRKRRTHYGSYETGSIVQPYQWNMDEDDEHYEDYCGRIAPASTYPAGTPGEYTRSIA
jgi:hypothetical protein